MTAMMMFMSISINMWETFFDFSSSRHKIFIGEIDLSESFFIAEIYKNVVQCENVTCSRPFEGSLVKTPEIDHCPRLAMIEAICQRN